MNKLCTYIFLLFSNAVAAQNFGCYDIPEDVNSYNQYDMSYHFNEGYNFSILSNVDWDVYEPNRCVDGWRQYYFANEEYKTSWLKMEGLVENGKREGIWIFYDNKYFSKPGVCFKGTYVHDKKEGLWVGYYTSYNGDSIALFEVFFKNDLPQGQVKEYFDNGHLYRTAFYEDGILNGGQIWYYDSDTLGDKGIMKKENYVHGQLEGERLEYSSGGYPEVREFFSKGLRDGNCYYSFGGKTEIQFERGKMNGVYKRSNYDGIILYELECRNGMPYIAICAHDDKENVLNPGTLKNGNGTLIQYGSDGIARTVFTYQYQLISGEMLNLSYRGKDTIEHGFLFTDSLPTFKSFDDFGRKDDLNMIFAWSQNFTYGTQINRLFPNGKIQYSISSIPGDTLVIEGYYENGQVMKSQKNFHGLISGTEKTYYDDGQLRSIGPFDITEIGCTFQSVKNGLFRYYHPNGALQAEVHYVNGVETGKSFFYDDGGNLRRIHVLDDNGRSYSVFDGDTVNMTDACGLKQGKWIEFGRSFSGACSTHTPYEKYYKDDVPYGYWEMHYRFNKSTYWISPDSAWVWFYSPDSIMIDEGLVVEGKQTGEWKKYDWETGVLEQSGNFCNNYREGWWKYYKPNGKIKKSVYFHYGDMVEKKTRRHRKCD